MRLVALAVVCSLIVGQNGGSTGAALPGYDAARRTRATGTVFSAIRRTAGDILMEEPNLCLSLRENEEQRQRQLLCNDRRNKFNFNPFGLRFGKRYSYRRAARRARTNNLN